MSSKRLSRLAIAVAFVFAVGPVAANRPLPTDPGFAGHWTSSQWGEHYILVEGSTVKIVYEHDDGRVLGTLDAHQGDRLVDQSAQPPTIQRRRGCHVHADRGQRHAIRRRHLALRRRRYTAGDWDLTWVDATIPPDIAAKFTDTPASRPNHEPGCRLPRAWDHLERVSATRDGTTWLPVMGPPRRVAGVARSLPFSIFTSVDVEG